MRVFRVETECGAGPYKAQCQVLGHYHVRGPVGRTGQALILDHGAYRYDEDLHPAPFEEGLPRLSGNRDFVCGFASRESANVWFDGWHDRLREVGHSLVEYEVPDEDVLTARRQLVFRKGRATKVATHPLTS